MAVIEIQGLSKRYRRIRGRPTAALNGLDLSVPEGGVFGFLGPNGSGKTTTIRCLLDLVSPTSGVIRLLDADPQRDLSRVISKVGSMIETPSFTPNFSGRRNLRLLAGLYGIDDVAVGRALERAGLAERAGDLVKSYSLGMRQRLGIAASLLKDPDVLILDEPANGLDPAGIKEVREVLRGLGAEGRTVFVSSHILSEVRQTCDRVAIIANGRCVAAGSVEEVLAGGGPKGVLVRLEDLDAGESALQGAGFQCARGDDVIRVALDPSRASHVARALAERGLYPNELRPEEADLEAVFLALTQNHVEEAA
ncbi:MAG: ABC transporter ATP-binding protein [Actinomycetota bacterium]